MAATVAPEQQHELLTPQQMMQLASMERAEPETDPFILRTAAQLSWLASQHHSSEYNQLKFGPKGAPVTYIPLSIQLPNHARDLRVYQSKNALKRAWWSCSNSPGKPANGEVNDVPVIPGGSEPTEISLGELQEALSLAISSPLPLPTSSVPLSARERTSSAKTSESHPINMSPMIPFELAPRLPAYLQDPEKQQQPTYLYLPYEITLDALTTPNHPTPPDTVQQVLVPPNSTHNSNPPSVIPPNVLQSELNKDMPTPPPAPHSSPTFKRLMIDPALIPLPPSPDEPSRDSSQKQNGESIAREASYFTQPLRSTASRDIQDAICSPLGIPSLTASPNHALAQNLSKDNTQNAKNGRVPNGFSNGVFPAIPNLSIPFTNGDSHKKSPPDGQILGNLFLSSCPGKKGVTNIMGFYKYPRADQYIYCLDDGELHFLGAPWEDYAAEAHQLGMDILRIPTPEGFAPLDVTVINGHLDTLITRYTLHGISILVHCRGGVGRAGLIASCWMLKLGLCGWIREIDMTPLNNNLSALLPGHIDVSPDPPTQDSINGADTAELVPKNTSSGNEKQAQKYGPQLYRDALLRLETIDLVERAIRVVRRRRSVKAIETFEQVHFLVQFVEHLRGLDSSRTGGALGVLQAFYHSKPIHYPPQSTQTKMEAGSSSTQMPMFGDFASDPRVHYNTVTQKWEFEDDEGNEMEWDVVKNSWVPIIDEELIKQQQAVYSVDGVDENTPAGPVAARESKKRKTNDSNGDITMNAGPAKKKGKKGDPSSVAKPPSKNTAIFVSHLPRDATIDEIAERFGKFGVIMEDDSGEPKIKMYADDRGNFVGEALVVYFMEASVDLAIRLLDEAELRLGDPSTIMRVKKGEFNHKQAGDGDAPRRVVDKRKATQRIVKLKKRVQKSTPALLATNSLRSKVGDWDFDDGFGPTEEVEEKPVVVESRVVVLKYMFTLQELQEDPSLLLDLKEDVREEAETVGDVTNVVLYDEEPEGIMTVKFRDPISAKACILKMNGRWFSGRKIEASYYSGKQRFRKSGGFGAEESGDASEKARLENFENWLMAEGETN
ncbi:hypothetical protein FRC17_010051 [Serendipita sp. 399]|nr:hypothetical protein FRC17_010051 [Serendipita sp. 399]